MNLTKEEIDFIKTLSSEMKTQDNRGTAQPFGLTLLEEKEEVRPDGFGDKMIRWSDESYYEDNFGDLKNDLLESYQDDPHYLEEICSFECFDDITGSSELEYFKIDVFNFQRSHEVKTSNFNFFLTEKAYHEHIRVNGHNLNIPKSYGIHLYRNTEMETLYKIIHKLANSL